MFRKSRIDAPGALHHIITRGIEQKEIFKDDPFGSGVKLILDYKRLSGANAAFIWDKIV